MRRECGGRLGAIYRDANGDIVVELYRWTDFWRDIDRADDIIELVGAYPGGYYVSGTPSDLERPQLRCPKCGAEPTVRWADVVGAIRRQPRRKSVVIQPDGTISR
jgi:hypothetical protein